MTEVAVLGGGCFWCTEAVYLELRGVTKVESGYTGGQQPDPTYEQVCAGATGHAEVVRLEFDPAVVSYRDLLEIFFTVHDPTTLNRQGNDVGTQYRSVIYHQSPAGGDGAPGHLRDGQCVGRAHRHRAGAGPGLLQGRGLPPGLFQPAPAAGLLRLRRRAQRSEEHTS